MNNTVRNLMTALAVAFGGAAAADIPSVVVDPTSSYGPTKIINGTFDARPFEAYSYNGTTYTSWPGNVNGGKTIAASYPNGVDGGWNSTETTIYEGGLFEWSNSPGTYVLDNANGYFIEMNAYNNAVFFQDLSTLGGDIMRWTLSHGYRSGFGAEQIIRVEVGAPNGAATGTGANVDSRITDATRAKYTYTGVENPTGATYGYAGSLANLRVTAKNWWPANGIYVIPEGQSVTRFAFIAVTPTNGGGNLLDDITFSTLIGNLNAAANEDGSVTVKGYWGDTDATKHICVKIGATVHQLDMSAVLNKNFTVTIPAAMIGEAAKIEVYHQDYESAKRTVKILHSQRYTFAAEGASLKAWCTNAVHTVELGCDHAGEANRVTVTVSANNAPYTGAPYARATLTGETSEWTACGLALPTLSYEGRGETSYGPSAVAPTASGTYVAKAVLGTAVASADFEIMKITAGEFESVSSDLVRLPVSIDGAMTRYEVVVSGAKLELTAVGSGTDWAFAGGALGQQYDSITLEVNAGAATAARTAADIAEEALATLRYTRATAKVTVTGSAPGTSLEPEYVTETAKMVPVTFASESEGTTCGGRAFVSTNTVRTVGSLGSIPFLEKTGPTFLGWTDVAGGSPVAKYTSAQLAAIDPDVGSAAETWYAVWSDALVLGEFDQRAHTFPTATATDGNRYPQVTIMFGREMSGEEIELPSGIAGYTEQASLKTAYSRVITVSPAKTAAEIATNYLAKVRFNHCLDQEVRVIIGTEASYKTFYYGDNEHYYQYVAYTSSAEDRSWTKAYERAKGMNYAGRKGYLVTVVSTSEDIFVYKASAGVVGWMGGTRILPGTKDGQYYTGFTPSQSAGYWYWAGGPECGEKLFAGETVQVSSFAYNVSLGYYFNWNDGEPNNSGNESCMTTLNIGAGYSTKSVLSGVSYSWNDIPQQNYAWGNGYAAVGFLVEFGDRRFGDSTDDDPSIASASGYVIAAATIKAPIVTFDALEGEFLTGAKTVSLPCPDALYTFPAVACVRQDCEFLGWFDNWTNGAVRAENDLLTLSDHTLYAKWVSKAIDPGQGEKTVDFEIIGDGAALKGATNELNQTDFAIPEMTDNGTAAGALPFTVIREYAFCAAKYDRKYPGGELTSVTIPSYVREIQPFAFENCRRLTNVTFNVTRDYVTREVRPLLIDDWAFTESSVSKIVFPAGSKVVLGKNCFSDAKNLTDIYILGDVEVEGQYPFRNIGGNLPEGTKVKEHLSPTLAANAAYVYSLTNGMDYAHVEIDQGIEGAVDLIGTPDVANDPMTFGFSVKSDSPWLTVNESTVYLFYSTTLAPNVFVGTGNVIRPVPGSLVDNGDDSYTVKFAKPATPVGSGSAFFRLCVGAER